MNRLRVLTWHVHGAYLYYLAHAPHEFVVPVKEGRPEGYGGRCGTLAWPDNLQEMPAAQIREQVFDCVLFQSRKNYLVDQYEILTPEQQRLPRIYLEHDPPRESPTDTQHVVDDPEVLVVQVTHFNDLMWNCGRSPTRVIEHGVTAPADVRWTGEQPRGLVVVNGLASRGRRLGLDLFERVRTRIPLDLVGMGSEQVGGLGEVGHDELRVLQSRYRFLFNPIRYTSLGLAVCEALMIGVPVVGLATTEMATVIRNGENGYHDTNLERLIERMADLLQQPELAARLSSGARQSALARFGMERFIGDWNAALALVTERGTARPMAAS